MRTRPPRPLSPLHEQLAPVSRLAGISLAGLATVALFGCTVVGPDYKRPEVALPTAWRAAQPDAADVANTAWWEAFGDAELNTYIATALEANKDLLLATLRIEEFDARLQVSRAANYAQLGVDSAAQRQRYSEERPVLLPASSSPSQNAFLFNGVITYELDLWGRVKRANEAARADLLATEEARRTVMLSLVSSVATSYMQLLGLDQQLLLVRQALKNREDTLALAETKFQGGSGTRLAVAQARSVVDEVAATIPEIELQISTLENAMSSLLGGNPGTIRRRTLAALVLPAIPQGVPSDVLSRRPDVLAAEQALVSANARIGVAKAQYFPTISLTGMLGVGSDDLKWITANTARTGLIGASILAPIFTGGRIEGDVRQTEAVQKQMVVRYQQAVQTALKETEDALVSRSKSGERSAAVGRQVASLQEVAKLSRMRYEGGHSSFQEVLDAERQVYEAQSLQALRQRDTYVALISVYKAMGGGWMVEQDKLRAPKAPSDKLVAAPVAEAQVVAATVQEAKR